MRTATSLLLCLALLAAAAAAQQTQQRDPLPVPDVPGYKTLKCDFHMHTVFSDGDVWPTIRLIEAFRDGLDCLAITDHAWYNPKKEDVKADVSRPYVLTRRLAPGMGLVLVPGIEINDGNTHFNALFINDWSALVGVSLKEALTRAKAQGAFAFWNHPGWKGKAEWWPMIDDLYSNELFRGMELLNGSSFYDEAYPWFEEKKLAILANSDVHGVTPPGRGRPVTLVFARTVDVAGIKEALNERRTAAWMNGEVWGSEEHLVALWNGAIEVERPELRWQPGDAGIGLSLRNASAFPFHIKLGNMPPWLRGASTASIKPEGGTAFALSVAKDAPAGTHRLELEVEVGNFHPGPGRKLHVKLPVTVTVER